MATRKTATKKAKKSKEESTGGVDGAEKKPAEEKEPKKSDENARPPIEAGPSRGRKLDPTKVKDIRARLAKGEKASDIAAVYDLHPSSVDDIRVGRTWASVV